MRSVFVGGSMTRSIASKVNNEAGSMLIEFTAVLSILLAMTFAMIDFGRYVYANNVIESAAQEGARAGLQAGNDIQSAVFNKLITLDQDQATVSFQDVAMGGETQVMLQVDVTYQFRFITPFLEAAAGGPVQLHGSAGMLRYPTKL